MDGLAIWNRALSATEVDALYAGQVPQTGLVAGLDVDGSSVEPLGSSIAYTGGSPNPS